MASGKRQPSKQKRTNQNRQERAARQARASAAAAAASAAAASGSSSARPSGAAARGSLLGRLRGASSGVSPAARPASSSGGRPSAGPAAVRGPGAQPVGFRAALTALLAAIAAIVVTFVVQQPVDERGDVYTRPQIVAEWAQSASKAVEAAPTADAPSIVKAIGDDWMPHRSSERTFVALLPMSLAVVLPVLSSYLLFRSVQQRRGSKVVSRAMYAVLIGAFLTFSLMTFFLPTVIAAWVAGFQVRRADRNDLLAAQAEAGGAGPDDGEVIEAEVVDEADGDRG